MIGHKQIPPDKREYHDKLTLLHETRERKHKFIHDFIVKFGDAGLLVGIIFCLLGVFGFSYYTSYLFILSLIVFLVVLIGMKSDVKFIVLFVVMLGVLSAIVRLSYCEAAYECMSWAGWEPDSIESISNVYSHYSFPKKWFFFQIYVMLGGAFSFGLYYGIARVRMEYRTSFPLRVISLILSIAALIPIGYFLWIFPWSMTGAFIAFSFSDMVQFVEHAWVILLLTAAATVSEVIALLLSLFSAFITLDNEKSIALVQKSIVAAKLSAFFIILGLLYYNLVFFAMMMIEGVYTAHIFISHLNLAMRFLTVFLITAAAAFGLFGRIAHVLWSRKLDKEIYRLKVEIAPDGDVNLTTTASTPE